MDSQSLGKRLVERIGQCVMTCPSTSCYNGIDNGNEVVVGGQLRYFGDGHQISKKILNKRLWRIPVMDGEFLVEEVVFSFASATSPNAPRPIIFTISKSDLHRRKDLMR